MASRSPAVTAWALAGASLVALGIARFSYALVLPSMRADLGLTYGRSGLLGTANTFGYFVGSLTLPAISARRSMGLVFRVGVCCTAVSIAATGISHLYVVLLLLRLSAGYFGASAFILGSTLAAMHTTRHAGSVAVFNAGAGAGVIVGGALVPVLVGDHPDRWPVAWFVLGAVAVLVTAFVLSAPIDAPPVASPVSSSVAASAPMGPRALRSAGGSLAWLTAAYLCFGAGYIVYVTFVVSTLRSSGATTALVTVAFIAMGIAAVACPWTWRSALASWSSPTLFATSLGGQAVAALLLAGSHAHVAMVASAALFGAAFLISPAVVTMTVRSQREPREWAAAIGRVTAVFAAAQAVAPWLSGELIDRWGSRVGPLWTATWSLAGIACCLVLGPAARLSVRRSLRSPS